MIEEPICRVEKTSQDQKRAADPTISVWASANAGAGKTKVLIDRIARLLLNDTLPEKILAVTYTKAAAAEMTTRLFETLGEWAIAEDKPLAEKLHQLDEKLVPDLAKARALFARALETPGGLKIETIHAFCGNILKRFPLEAGVSPGFEVIEDISAKVLFEKAFNTLLEQKAALLLRIEALTFGENHKDLIKAAIDKLGADFVFDKNEVSAKLNAIFGLSEGDKIDEAKARAINNIDKNLLLECAEILEQSDKKTDIGTADSLREIRISNIDDSFDIALNFIVTAEGKLRKSPPFTSKFVNNRAICKLFGEPVSKGEDWIGGQIADFWDEAQKVQSLMIKEASLDLLEAASFWQSHYSDLKNAAGKLDFADLLTATRKLLNQKNGGALWVLYKLDQGLSHVLIDESQDTSDEQWQLLTPLLDALEDENYDKFAKGPRTRFIVGDEKQSIYSFQGASPERFDEEHKKFTETELLIGSEYKAPRRSIPFEVSFRTGQEILNIVDRVWDNIGGKIDFSADDPELELKFLQKRAHHSAREAQATQFELWPVEIANENFYELEAWDIPLNSDSETAAPNLLATRIAREIKARIESGELVWEKGADNKEYARPMVESDIMILVKQRKALFYSIIRKLKAEGLNVAGADQIELSQEPAIVDLIAIGRFVLRPEDDFNLACVLKGVFCGLLSDDEHLFPLAYERGQKSLWQRLREAENPIYSNPKDFLIAQTKRANDANPFEFFAKLLDAKLPDGRTGWHAIIERFGQEAREPIDVFLDAALKADKMGAQDLASFLDIIEYKSPTVKRDLNGKNQGVKVMTVHASKGLEAKIVILPDTTRSFSSRTNGLYFDNDNKILLWAPQLIMEQKYITHLKESAKQSGLAEDNRLLYVAMTRARDRLIVCGHQPRKNQKSEYSKASWYEYFKNSENYFGFPKEKILAPISISPNEEKFALIWGNEINSSNMRAETIRESITNAEVPEWFENPPAKDMLKSRHIVPSMLLGEDDEEAFLAPSTGSNKSRYLRGKLIHTLLEGFSRIKPCDREKWAKEKLNRVRELSQDTKDEIINHSLGIIHNSDFSAYFAENSRAEVSILGKSRLLPDDMIVSGTIDRLIVGEKEVLVLDFKTNRPPPKTISEVPKIYINQMAAYYALLSETYPKHKIKCALLWTDTPQLMELDQAQIDTALKRIK